MKRCSHSFCWEEGTMNAMQQTLRKAVSLEGKGLHTARYAHIRLCPAPPDTGIVFVRTDLGGAAVPALAEHVSGTRRGTTLSAGGASVATVEHLLSALSGMGVDNALIETDNVEIPIFDGSARPFTRAIAAAGLAGQETPCRPVVLQEPLVVSDDNGGWIRIEPAEGFSAEVTVDFASRVLGVQTVRWDASEPYATAIAPARTFVFFHELAALHAAGLVRGGDADNAIVVVEKPVSPEEMEAMSRLFGVERLSVRDGYLDHLRLHFPDECGRHKLLDLLGDLFLSGRRLQAKVTAFKPGHALNTRAALALRKMIETTDYE